MQWWTGLSSWEVFLRSVILLFSYPAKWNPLKQFLSCLSMMDFWQSNFLVSYCPQVIYRNNNNTFHFTAYRFINCFAVKHRKALDLNMSQKHDQNFSSLIRVSWCRNSEGKITTVLLKPKLYKCHLWDFHILEMSHQSLLVCEWKCMRVKTLRRRLYWLDPILKLINNLWRQQMTVFLWWCST